MEKIYENIINEGKKNGESIEAINAKLKAAGATFHLNPDGGVANWTEAEMAEGFIPATEEAKDAVHLHDIMRYKPELAGQTITVTVAEGRYEVTYNANGNPVKAVRVNP